MRRGILFSLGLLEVLVAGVLVVIGGHVPRPETVGDSFHRVGQVTHSAEKQVQLMRQQVDEVRQKDFPKIAGQLRGQSQIIFASLKNQGIDFSTFEAINHTLTSVTQGLNNWSEMLNPDAYLPAATEPENTTGLLEVQDAATAVPSVSALERSTVDLERDFRSLQALVQRPVQTRSQQEVVLLINRCATNLDILDKKIRGDRFVATRDGFSALEGSLEIAVRQVEAASQTTYPVFSSNSDLTSALEMRPLWSEGKPTATSLRKAQDGVKAISRDLDEIVRMLPEVLRTFQELRQQLDVDRDCVSPPEGNLDPVQGLKKAVSCEDQLSEISSALATLLRSAERLRELSGGLRKTQEGLEQTLRTWPVLVETMQRSALVLNGSRQHLDTVLAQRVPYEQAVKGSLQVAQAAENLLQNYSTKLDVRLGEQEYSLGQMERGLTEVNEALPAVAQTANDFLSVLRWTFWVLGGLIGLHGLFLGFGASLKR